MTDNSMSNTEPFPQIRDVLTPDFNSAGSMTCAALEAEIDRAMGLQPATPDAGRSCSLDDVKALEKELDQVITARRISPL